MNQADIEALRKNYKLMEEIEVKMNRFLLMDYDRIVDMQHNIKTSIKILQKELVDALKIHYRQNKHKRKAGRSRNT